MTRRLLVLSMSLGLAASACSSDDSSGNGNDGGHDASAQDGGDDATSAADTAVAEASVGSGDDSPEPAPQALVRIANLSPDAPAVDVCVAPHGTSAFQGPLVGQLFAQRSGDPDSGAIAPGIAYAQVSAYISLDEGQYDVRIVPAGATTCDVALPRDAVVNDVDAGDVGSGVDAGPLGDGGVDGGLSGDAAPDGGPAADAGTDDAALDDGASGDDAGGDDASSEAGSVDGGIVAADGAADGGVVTDGGADADAASTASNGVADTTDLAPFVFNTSTTIVLAGDLSPAGADKGFSVTALADDQVLVEGMATLRAVNAVPSVPSVDVGLGSPSAGWVPLLTAVPFGGASAHSGPFEAAIDANGYLPIAPLAGATLSASPAGATTALATTPSAEIDPGSVATVFVVGGKTGDAANAPELLLCIDNQPVGGVLADCSVLP